MTISLTVGTTLPPLEKTVSQEMINLYARASGDYNPIHIDPEFAKKTTQGGTIAHGMLILAFVNNMMTAAFGKDWLETGSLDVRFKSAAKPGDTVTTKGEIKKTETVENGTRVRCTVFCFNQNNEAVITGDAVVTVKT
ncbi:MAG TPA: MaoC family dehydratase [Dehalococcoidales bacterium]|nr:MaoC family dehydratase [Dehalococcoidales bacterium]